MRSDGRQANELRPVKITPHFLKHPAGSCIIEVGNTRVLCAASLQESVPGWLKGTGRGWLTAEYSMLPGSSDSRVARERAKLGGRTSEIQRLIGRSLRMCLDLEKLGERAIYLDCDVLDADGGTRTAAITGSWVALQLAARKLKDDVPEVAASLKGVGVAAVSVGVVDGVPVLDLPYVEDKEAAVDMNVVMNSEMKFIEVQGTAESEPYDSSQLSALLSLAQEGIAQLISAQNEALQ